MSRIPYPVLLILTAAALAAAAVFSLSWGRYPVPLDAVWQTLSGHNADETYQNIIFNLRLPRIAAAILSLMADLAEDGYTVVNTTHNPEHPLLLHGRHPQSQTALLLADGTVQSGNTADILTQDALQELYQTDLRLLDIPGWSRRVCALAPLPPKTGQ